MSKIKKKRSPVDLDVRNPAPKLRHSGRKIDVENTNSELTS